MLKGSHIVVLLCAALKVDLATVFGLLTFILNFIPTVGTFIAVLLPVPILLLDSGVFSIPLSPYVVARWLHRILISRHSHSRHIQGRSGLRCGPSRSGLRHLPPWTAVWPQGRRGGQLLQLGALGTWGLQLAGQSGPLASARDGITTGGSIDRDGPCFAQGGRGKEYLFS